MIDEFFFEFVWLPTFERTSRKLLTEDDRHAIEQMLCENLEAGVLIRRTGGFRKMRYALAGGGKRTGARVIYLPDESCERIYMIMVYSKGTKEAMTREEQNELRKLATELKNEEC